jgi:hypothetical protein
MILYHFTSADRTKSILTQGLLPQSDRHNMLGGSDVVWLTERTTLCCTPAETSAIFERSGVRMENWLDFSRDVARLIVRIPSHDRKLAEYVPWLRKHWRRGMPSPDDKCWGFTGGTEHWIYFGSIPPSNITLSTDATAARVGKRSYKETNHRQQAA